MALSWSLDKIGPLAHSADDCGLVFEAIAGPDPGDPSTLALPFRHERRDPPAGKWKLRLIANYEPTDQPAVMENFRRALEPLRDVAEIEERPLPDFPYHEAVMTILMAEAGAAFAGLCADGGAEGLRAPETRITPYALQTIPATDYINALRLRQRIHREIMAWWEGADAVITPTQLKVAPPVKGSFTEYWGAHRRTRIASLGNLIGLPCVSVPNGFGERGLPTAIQFVGRPLSENTLLAIADAYQERTDWHLRHPPGI
jgi:aspartyl-tRNA(Asn)/glutamyl-tRNA(Gln) amidotransferase subunit A